MHGRFASFRSRAVLACVPALGLVLLAGAGAASAARAPAHSRTAVRIALEHALAHWHPVFRAADGPNVKQVTSGNWSGYADDHSSGAKYSKVTGKWTEPKGTCGSAQSLAVFWVGIDGFTSQTVEQDGTIIFCPGGGAAAQYFTWWEMFPANNIQLVGGTVKPGDKISASVTRSGTRYTMKVTDSTRPANSFSTTQSCGSCANTSAEWIAEAPSGQSGQFPLARFGTWTLTGATVKAGSKSGTISTFPDDKITMVNSSGKTLAQPGALNSAGNSFKVTWKAST
jgi:hypothetical protein